MLVRRAKSVPGVQLPSKRPVVVSLIFHSTRSDNLGVGALTVSEIEIIRQVARNAGREVRVHVIDWKGIRAPYVTGPDITMSEVDGKAIINPFGFFATVRRGDIVIDIGAGDSFADIYGPKRLRTMLVMKFLTHLALRPLVVAPQTIGPFKHALSKFLARLTLNLSAVVATRDTLSTEWAHDLGVRRKVIEASDVALRLPYDKPVRTEGGPVRVGLNVSGLLMAGGYSRNNMFGLKSDYPALIDRLVRTFTADIPGCELHLVPHVIVHEAGSPEDDYSASEAIARAHPNVRLAPAFANPSEAKTYIAGLDFFMGARMHACIAAFSSGVPVIPMAYSRKFAGLFGSLGYDHTVDCTTEDADAIHDRIVASFHDRERLVKDLNRSLRIGQEKLGRYQDALAALIASVR